MRSAIVEGRIRHARFGSIKHDFEYPLYFFKFDIDELEQLAKQFHFFGFNRWNILSLQERDYLYPVQKNLRTKVEDLLREQGVNEIPSQIELVTQARYFGWVFNPVSFFFCRNALGKIIAIIADVNNTFGEGHAYVLREFKELSENRIEARADKVFHVSPFFDRKGEYRFEFMFFPNSVDIILDYHENNELRLASVWTGKSWPFSFKEVFLIVLRYPFAGWLTLIRIHTQAAMLHFVKKLPIFKKPEPVSKMTIRRKDR